MRASFEIIPTHSLGSSLGKGKDFRTSKNFSWKRWKPKICRNSSRKKEKCCR